MVRARTLALGCGVLSALLFVASIYVVADVPELGGCHLRNHLRCVEDAAAQDFVLVLALWGLGIALAVVGLVAFWTGHPKARPVAAPPRDARLLASRDAREQIAPSETPRHP
ncbi:MAG: hypothetical protein ACYDBQ_06510 [Thermoplasmatota archaeon]